MPRLPFKDRTQAITAFVFAIGFLICGIAWMRFFAVAALNPSPVRYVEFITERGSQAPFRQLCAGPSFGKDDTAWRFCTYEDDAGTAQWGLVRFDLAQGTAVMRWPLPEAADAQILALAESPAGDLAVAWGSPDLSAVYLIRHEGGVVPLGIPPSPPRQIFGLAWTSDALELVGERDGGAQIVPNQAGIWGQARIAGPPAGCGGLIVCALQAAYRTDAGWHFIYAAAPASADDPARVTIDLLRHTETGTSQPIQSIALTELDASQYAIEDGALVRLGALLDRSPGNAVNWAVEAAPFVLHGDVWERVMAPQPDASFYASNYQIGPDRLHWIPGMRYPQRGWQVGDWLALRASGEGVSLARLQGDSGPTLTRNTVLALSGGSQVSLLPASDGGYWVLGPYGAYLKADVSLRRADALSVPERIVRAFENFGRLEPVSDEFYRETRAAKMAAFPMVLLSLPIGYLLVFFVRQTRRNTRAWIVLLLQVSAVYVIVATIFFLWFWEMMDDF